MIVNNDIRIESILTKTNFTKHMIEIRLKKTLFDYIQSWKIQQWLTGHCNEKTNLRWEELPTLELIAEFENEADATLFTLKWG